MFDWHRIAVRLVMHLRIRGESDGHHVTALIVRGRKRQQKGTFLFPRFSNGLCFASDHSRVLLEAAFQYLLVEILKAGSRRQWHHKITSRVPDRSLDSTLFVSFRWLAKVRFKQVVTAKGCESSCFLARATPLPGFVEDQFDGGGQIVIANSMGNASKVPKGLNVRPEKTFLILRGETHGVRATRVAEVHHEKLHRSRFGHQGWLWPLPNRPEHPGRARIREG